MANENSKTPTQMQPQMIPLSKIHDLPNVFNPKPQDKTLGSMVLSIESSGVKEAVILRQRSDGEYELLSGYRRRRASELAKKQDIPAHVYEMTMQEAIAYRKAVKQNPNAPIPGKLVVPNEDKDKAFAVPSEKPKEDKAPAAPGEKPKEDKAPATPGEKPKEDKAPATPGEKPKEDKAPAAPGEKPKEDKAPAAPGEKPNLHRDKISSYDLSRALRMKMEGMKQKAGRRKRGYSANELQSDAKLAQEMGMSIAKLNRMIHLSEAVKGICDLVDDNKLTISVASEIAYLKPKTQESVLHLLDLGYKATNERVSRMKKAEAGGQKLDEMTLRSILDDKDIAPKQPEPVKQPEAPAAPTAGTEQPPIPASPDIPAAPDAPPTEDDVPPWEEPEKGTTQEQGGAQPAPVPGTPVPGAAAPEQENDPLKGPQERPEVTKVILTGDRLRKYFPDVSMTPREIEESVYSALEERRQRQLKEQQKATIFKRGGPTR